MSGPREPPRQIWFEVDEALELLAMLEDLWEELALSEKLILILQIESQISVLHRKLEFDEGGS